MWLIRKLTPDFKTIADFRKDNKEAIRKIYKEFTLICKYLGLFGGELVESGKNQGSLTDPDSRAMLNNQRVEVCYNIKATVDSKHKLTVDHEVVNEVNDYNQLNEMGRRAKKVLEVEELEVLADKGNYSAEKIKECVEEGIIPYVPERERKNIEDPLSPESAFTDSKFIYDKGRDVYICPDGSELIFKRRTEQSGKAMRIYQGTECKDYSFKAGCSGNLGGSM